MVFFHENGIAPPFRIKCPPDGGIPVAASVQEDTLPPTKLDETKTLSYTISFSIVIGIHCDIDIQNTPYRLLSPLTFSPVLVIDFCARFWIYHLSRLCESQHQKVLL
jgi:prepilin signal peptidase PulO-like enzyme (type II secretory pathway)